MISSQDINPAVLCCILVSYGTDASTPPARSALTLLPIPWIRRQAATRITAIFLPTLHLASRQKRRRRSKGNRKNRSRKRFTTSRCIARLSWCARSKLAHGRLLTLDDDHAGNSGWIELDFTPSQYRRFLYDIELDERLLGYFEDKIRHDYDPRRCILVLRMLTPVHEVFLAGLSNKASTHFKMS